MSRYLLDTNTVSYVFRRQGGVAQRLAAQKVGTVFLSAVTEAELCYGIARNPVPRLEVAVRELLMRVEVLPWTSDVARSYGRLRAGLEKAGITVALHDLQIAAHALQQKMILVSHDRIFTRMPELIVEDWL
ncbi:MAG: type II toxin-antitoxin system VapC family toxin [Burkholderiaceae bacterium]